jgi:hypothetical protein
MGTSKTKAESKTKKSSAPKKTVKSKKIESKKSIPGEEEIREKAREIYFERITRGEHGTPESDWLKAEQLLKSSKK